MNFFEEVYEVQLHKLQTLFFISRIRERFFGLRPQNDREGVIVIVIVIVSCKLLVNSLTR